MRYERAKEIHELMWDIIAEEGSERCPKERENIHRVKRNVLNRLLVYGKITEDERETLSLHSDCAACYVSYKGGIGIRIGMGIDDFNCYFCPIKRKAGKCRNIDSLWSTLAIRTLSNKNFADLAREMRDAWEESC